MGIEETHNIKEEEVASGSPDSSSVEEGPKIPATEAQLTAVAELEKTVNNHSRLGDDEGFRRDLKYVTDLAPTDWEGFKKEIKELTSRYTAEARAVLEQFMEEHDLDDEKVVEKTNFFLMGGPQGPNYKFAIHKIKGLTPELQTRLAEEYFKSTIGDGLMPILGDLKEQYRIYSELRNTAFGDKFAELEDARLRAHDFGGFKHPQIFDNL